MRIHLLQTLLKKKKIPVLLVTNFYSINYLTGCNFISSHEREGYMLLTYSSAHFFTDGRYEVAAQQFFHQTEVQVHIITAKEPLSFQLKETLKKEKISTVGFESSDITYKEFELLSKNLSPITLKPTDQIVATLRELKDDDEVKLIAEACRLTDECLEDFTKKIKKGVSEKELYYFILQWARDRELEIAFEPIVAFGQNSALPHYSTLNGNATLQKDTLILVDMGLKYKEYCADITRMFFYGHPSTEIVKAYVDLQKIQQQAVDKLSTFTTHKEVDLFCRGGLIKKGYPSMPHSTGHGIGLEVHEGFRLFPKAKGKLKKGQIFSIEPGVYFPGKWGMRIEDTCTREKALTRFTKELVIKV